MRIDPAGFPFVAIAALPALVALLFATPAIALALLALPIAIALFFRDPDRSVPHDPHLVLAPADGRVMHAGEARPDEAPPGDWRQISIFLSLLDVHINRSPYGGRVVSVTHVPGRYLAAYRAASATQNERTDIVVERVVAGETRRVVYRQLVGQLARRIVTRIHAGDDVATGERIGLMKFGSRMDVFLPSDVTLEVTKGRRAVAGETVLGRFPTVAPAIASKEEMA